VTQFTEIPTVLLRQSDTWDV